MKSSPAERSSKCPPSRQSQWAPSVEPRQAALSRLGLRRAEKDIPLPPAYRKIPPTSTAKKKMSPLSHSKKPAGLRGSRGFFDLLSIFFTL